MPMMRRRPLLRAAAVGTVAYQGSKRGAMAGQNQAAEAAAPPPPPAALLPGCATGSSTGGGPDRGEDQPAGAVARLGRPHRRGVRRRQGAGARYRLSVEYTGGALHERWAAISRSLPLPPRGRGSPDCTGLPPTIRIQTSDGCVLRLAEHHEAVDADQADRKHAERPPRVRAADVEQRADRTEARRHDPDRCARRRGRQTARSRRSAG